MNDEYYIPVTLKELIERLQQIIRNSDGELIGEEYVIDSSFLIDGDHTFPPNTLILTIRKDRLGEDGEESAYGKIYIMPEKTRTLM